MITPSELTLYYNLHILCFIKNNNSVNIYSLPNIEKDKYFKCTEFSYKYEKLKIGIIVYKTNSNGFILTDYNLIYLEKNFYKYIYESDDIFDISILLNEYNFILEQIHNENSMIETRRLKKSYLLEPFNILKRNMKNLENEWNFFNIFNEYFCSCKGERCLKKIISKECKYYFYLYIIDNNNDVYKKKDFLLMDFILKKYSSDDALPIFEEIINQNLTAHYLTEDENIYEKYCFNKKKCDLVIHVDKNNYKINDDFLEKHLTLILKLNKVISSVGVNITFINNIFYNIDYITYICLGHGISYFKSYLYKNYYGPTNFDKLLIPNSNKLIYYAIKYGWKEDNLIKLNLPRWDKYNIEKYTLRNEGKIKSNSIFIMFTWRELQTSKNISIYYIKNILNLLKNEKLINEIFEFNITLYFSIHHKFLKYKKDFIINNNIEYLEENEISECLSKTNLIVTDYSSIIFDAIYRRKPYIIYIPDAYDPKIKINYLKQCYNVIKKFKYNQFPYENIFFDLNSTINKINYYIENKFKLDRKLVELYDEFNFKKDNSTKKLIEYLLK